MTTPQIRTNGDRDFPQIAAALVSHRQIVVRDSVPARVMTLADRWNQHPTYGPLGQATARYRGGLGWHFTVTRYAGIAR